MTMTHPAIRAVGIVKTYGTGPTTVRALDGASLEIGRGRFTAIMGPSGSGKSTLMHAMAGLDTVDSGSIHLGELDITGLSEKQRTLLRRSQLGFIFQSYNRVPALTARENIELPLRLGARTPDAAWIAELADTLGIADRLTHRPAELSGGQQQRVAVARALATRPAVVFADEPTGALDSRTSQALLEFLRRAAREFGQTIVMVTHDPAAAAYADRVEFLSDGRVVDAIDGPSADVVLSRMARFDQVEVAA
jgi:putative ABC transport system ATP-binding protein